MNIRRNLGSHSPNTIASYPDYLGAQTAIDKLSDNGFPVQYTSIIADELEVVRRSKDRLGWLKSTFNGMLNGLIIGAIMGFLFGMFNLMSPIQTAILVAANGAAMGGTLGAIYGLIGGLFYRKNADADRNATFTAKYYDVIVDEQYAHHALEVLEESFAGMKPPQTEFDRKTFTVPPPSLGEAEHAPNH